MAYIYMKLYYETLDDPKMVRLSDHLYRRTIELFLLAGITNKEGELPTVADIAFRLRADETVTLQDLEALSRIGITELINGRWWVKNFAKRQAPVTAAERVSEYRKRHNPEPEEVSNETLHNDNLITNNKLIKELINSPLHVENDTKIVDVTFRNENRNDSLQELCKSWQLFKDTVDTTPYFREKLINPTQIKERTDGTVVITHPDREAIAILNSRFGSMAKRHLMVNKVEFVMEAT